jgi:Skp family chaperone for outer membrane proteins
MELPLLIVMAVFTGVAAIAMVVQAAMMYGVSKSARAVSERVAQLAPKVESLAETSRAAIDEGRASMAEITSRTKEILDTTQRQLNRVDRVLEDVEERARIQFDRAEAVVDDAVNRAQQTVAIVHGGIMKPIREINGVAAGVRAAIHYFMRGGRPTPDRVTVDEEMFI